MSCVDSVFRRNAIVFNDKGMPFGDYRLLDQMTALFVGTIEKMRGLKGTFLRVKTNPELQKLEADQEIRRNFKKEELVSAFLHCSRGEVFRFLKIFSRLSDSQLNEFLTGCFDQAAEGNPGPLIEKLMKLFTLQKIESIIRTEFPLLEGVKEEALSLASGAKKDFQLKRLEESRSIYQIALIYLINFCNLVVDTLLYVFHLKEANQGDEGIFGADYRAERRYANFRENALLLSGWFVALTVFLESRVKAALLFTVGGILGSIGIYAYLEWFRPCPDNFLNYNNLVAEVFKGNVPPVYGRDNEIDQVIDRLQANRGSVRKHPILHGKTGVGKTEIINGLAWRIATGKVPPEMRHLKIFSISTADLVGDGPFARVSKLETIRTALKGAEKDVIIFFDEIHTPFMRNGPDGASSMMSQKFKTLLNPGVGNFQYCIGATTEEEYRAHIEPDKAMHRRFKLIQVDPIEPKQTFAVLSDMVQKEGADLLVDETAIKTLAYITEGDEGAFKGAPQPYTSKNLLSEAFARAREPKQNEKRKRLNDLLDQKLTLDCSQSLAAGETLFTYTQAGSERARKLRELNEQITSLETVLGEEKKELEAYSFLIKKLGALKKSVTWAAVKAEERLASKKEGEEELKRFILSHHFLRRSLEKIISKRRAKFPDVFVVDQKAIETAIAQEKTT